MPHPHTVLADDTRAISAIYFFSEGAGGYEVGKNCEEIVAYDEHGEMDYVPWLAVRIKGKIAIRLPARFVSIHYAA